MTQHECYLQGSYFFNAYLGEKGLVWLIKLFNKIRYMKMAR